MGDSKEEINRLLGNQEFVSMIRNYLDKKNNKSPQTEEQPKTEENKEQKENPVNQENQTLEQALSQNMEGGQMQMPQDQNINIDNNIIGNENQNIEQEKKEDQNNNNIVNQDDLNTNKQQNEDSVKKDYMNMLDSFGIKDNNNNNNNKDTINNQNENFLSDPKNDIIMSNKEKDASFHERSSGSPSKNSISNTSSSGGDPRKYLGKKRYEDEYICKQICENKNSSPSLILLCKIIEEFTYSVVLDTLLKNSLSQNVKLDSLLQGLIDSEGINKVILMLLKFRS